MVTISEAPDAQTAVATVLGAANLGNVRTETFPAFSDSDMMSIIGKL
jgi:uncharacterized protein with GYD domain